ncbi:hypothetical protein MYA_0144 [Burkholderia sp. KJ006]|nr:hypothetical protein MYA_0144 [Burkholderia sp. KJ006]
MPRRPSRQARSAVRPHRAARPRGGRSRRITEQPRRTNRYKWCGNESQRCPGLTRFSKSRSDTKPSGEL